MSPCYVILNKKFHIELHIVTSKVIKEQTHRYTVTWK